MKTKLICLAFIAAARIELAARNCLFLGPGNDHARAQAHDRQEAKDRKAAPRLLDGLLRKGCLISSGVSSAKRGAVDDLNPSSAPEILGCDGLLGFANKVIVDLLKPLERQSGPSLAVGAVL